MPNKSRNNLRANKSDVTIQAKPHGQESDLHLISNHLQRGFEMCLNISNSVCFLAVQTAGKRNTYSNQICKKIYILSHLKQGCSSLLENQFGYYFGIMEV